MYRLLVIVALAVLLVPAPEAARAATPQLRAFWVDAFHEGIKKPEHTRRLIADAERAGANAVIVQIRRRGDSYYRDSIEPIAADVAEGYDPLADLIAQAHERGIQVHAWVAALPAWKDGYPQPDRSHVWYQHGPDKPGWENWFTRDIDGRAGECAAQGDCGYYLDPGHPEVLDYTVRVVTHLASRYAIDGLHLDYIRYASPRYGYNPASLARFQVASGRSDVPQPEDAQWMQWRRDQVTKLVKRIYLSLNVVRPEAVLSVAAIAWGGAPPNGDFTQSSPYRRVMQDWKGWLDAGYIDLAIPMIYDKQDGGQQQGWYEGWVDYVAQKIRAAVSQPLVSAPGLTTPTAIYSRSGAARRPASARRCIPTLFRSTATVRHSWIGCATRPGATAPPRPATPGNSSLSEGIFLAWLPKTAPGSTASACGSNVPPSIARSTPPPTPPAGSAPSTCRRARIPPW